MKSFEREKRSSTNGKLDGFVNFVFRWRSTLWTDGWMDDLQFYVLFNSISVISGRWADDNESLCAMEPRFLVEKILHQMELELATARSVGQRLTH